MDGTGKKKVGPSRYIDEMLPAVRLLGEALGEEYKYYSILLMDNSSRRWSVSAAGTSVVSDSLYNNRGMTVRVTDDKGYAEYSLNGFCKDDISHVTERLRESLKAFDGDGESFLQDYMKREIPASAPLEMRRSGEYLVHPADIDDGVMIERLSELRKKLIATDERIFDAGARAEYQEIHKLFVAPGRELSQDILWGTGAVSAMAKSGQEIKTAFRSFSVLGGAEILDEMDGALGKVAETAVTLLSSEPMIPGTYECICSPEVTGMIVHEAFGHGVEMDMFVKDRALAKNYIGKRVASDLVTMHDGGIAADQTGSYFFDDEGQEATDTVIIEKGILKRGISDLLSAMTLGTGPTGNGRRQDYGHKAYTRMTNTFFEGGGDDPEDMIRSVVYGFLLESPESGMEDPKNWGIQCMVSVAKEIRDGKLTGRVFSPVVLTGYVPDLLKSITMMSPRVELSGGGMCGKGYKEWVKVSDGGPYIKATIRLG